MIINDNLVHAVLVALLRELPEQRAQAVVDEWRSGTATAKAERAANAERCLDFNVDELELGVRALNALRKHGIETVRQLTEVSPWEMSRWEHVGRKTINEVRELLQGMGLDLRLTRE